MIERYQSRIILRVIFKVSRWMEHGYLTASLKRSRGHTNSFDYKHLQGKGQHGRSLQGCAGYSGERIEGTEEKSTAATGVSS